MTFIHSFDHPSIYWWSVLSNHQAINLGLFDDLLPFWYSGHLHNIVFATVKWLISLMIFDTYIPKNKSTCMKLSINCVVPVSFRNVLIEHFIYSTALAVIVSMIFSGSTRKRMEFFIFILRNWGIIWSKNRFDLKTLINRIKISGWQFTIIRDLSQSWSYSFAISIKIFFAATRSH